MSNTIKKFIEFFSSEKDSPVIPAIQYKARNIDGTSTGTTNLFTTQVVNFRSMQLVIDLTSVSNFVTPPTISVGTNAGNYDNILPATILTGLSAGSTHILIQIEGIMPDIAQSTSVKLNISIAAVASTYTVDATIFGFYDS